MGVLCPRQAGQGRTRARVPPVRRLSVSTEMRPKFGLGMGQRRTKKRCLSVCSRVLGRDMCPFGTKQTRSDHLRSCVGVDQAGQKTDTKKQLVMRTNL